MSMRLSVILPVYGEANYISEAIISTLDNIAVEDELIITLDRTSNTTKAIIKYFASKDKRIVVINSPNPGITSALNLGIAHSDADFIARMDADDVVINDRFNVQKNFLESHPKHVLIGSNIQLIDSDGKIVGLKVYPYRHQSIKRMISFYNPIAHPSVMIRRISLLESGLYEIGTDGYEDLFLWNKLINFGKFKNTRKSLLKYRIHDNQITKKNNVKLSRSHLDYLKPYTKSAERLNDLYNIIMTRKLSSFCSLFSYKFISNYFISLIISPKSTLNISYYYVINALLAKVYSKQVK